MVINAGTAAPPFKFRDADGTTYTNEEFLGRKQLVLAFYPLAFTSG